MSEQLKMFMKQIQQSSYADKYRRWSQYLQMQSQSDNYLTLLGIFLEYFPFNYHYWLQYIQLTKFQEYQIALKRNPKSYQLWTTYLHNCKLMWFDQEKQKYRKQLQKAISEIGADSRTLSLYEDYYDMLKENVKFQFFKKLFTRGLVGLQSMFIKFQEWFGTLSQNQVANLAIKEFKGVANNLNQEQLRNHLHSLINTIYRKTLTYRTKRLKLEGQINCLYFDGSEAISKDKEIWRDLIDLERENGVVQNVSYLYERVLMAQTDNVQLWQEVFHYMQNQTNKYTKVQSILRNNKLFFLKFDLNIYFYWCDLEQRQSAGVARKMYEQLVKQVKTYQVYERWIQLQVREKQWPSAKKIYDDILIVFREDIQMLCFILVEYSQFVVRYYKDLDYAKKLLKAYFDHLPFNHYLFTKYLQFLKNFQNDQGFYQELMQFITDALTKAKSKLNNQEFINLTKIIKFYLRSTLSSIYLIKISQHKMLEAEEKITKNNN